MTEKAPNTKMIDRGRPQWGIVATVPHFTLAEMLKFSALEWVWIDAEHGGFDAQSAAQYCAVLGRDKKTFVRIPDKSPTNIQRFLDIGADGIIVPMVESAAEIDHICRYALYPPLGQRSVGIARAHGYGANFKDYIRDKSYKIFIQIETALAVENIDSILSTAAVDGVLIGPYDLSGSLGCLGDISSPIVQEKIKIIFDACQKHHKISGIFAGNSEAGLKYKNMGFDMIAVGLDSMVFQQAIAKNLDQLNQTE